MLNRYLNQFRAGDRLLEAPVPDLIESLGKAIANAQFKMDSKAVEIGAKLGETKVRLKDEEGKEVERSLLELGFTPTFYHFQEAEVEVKMTISLEVTTDVEFEAGLGGEGEDGEAEEEKSLLPFGAAMNLDVHHKFGFQQEGSSRVWAKLVSVPAPQTFTDALRRNAGIGTTG